MEESTAEHQVIEVERHLRQLDDEWVKALVRRDGEMLDRIIADGRVKRRAPTTKARVEKTAPMPTIHHRSSPDTHSKAAQIVGSMDLPP